MSAFSRTKLAAPDIAALVTDPELLAATGTIRNDIDALGYLTLPRLNDLLFNLEQLQALVASGNTSLAGNITTVVAGMAQPGDLKLKLSASGLPDAGWTRVSGDLSAQSLYGQMRLALANFSQSINANNTNAVFWVTPSTTGIAYNPGTGATQSIAAHPHASGGNVGAAVADDEYIYTAGGSALGGSAIRQEVRRLSLTTNSWATVAMLPTPRLYAVSADMGGRQFLVAGGQVASATTVANMSDALHLINTNTGVLQNFSLGFRAVFGRAITLKRGAFAGYALISWAASQTTNGPSSSSTIVASPRAVLVSPAGVVQEIDALTFPYFYEREDGKIVEVSTTFTDSTLRDLTRPLGTQSSPYALPAYAGLTLSTSGGSLASPKVMAGGQLPVTDVNRYYLMATDGTPEPASQAFYQVKT